MLIIHCCWTLKAFSIFWAIIIWLFKWAVLQCGGSGFGNKQIITWDTSHEFRMCCKIRSRSFLNCGWWGGRPKSILNHHFLILKQSSWMLSSARQRQLSAALYIVRTSSWQLPVHCSSYHLEPLYFYSILFYSKIGRLTSFSNLYIRSNCCDLTSFTVQLFSIHPGTV